MNEGSLRAFREQFAALDPPDPAILDGFYRGEFAGPAWLQRSSGLALGLLGMPRWWGKVFDGQGNADNLISRGESLERVLPVEVRSVVSLVDGRQGITLVYGADSGFLWRWVVDELRQIDEKRLLGMAVADVVGLRRFPLPFLLHHQEDLGGLEIERD